MSKSEVRKTGLEFPKLEGLESAVRRALRQLEVWRERALASEAERRQMEERLGELGVMGDGDPSELIEEVERLRVENSRLRERLAEGRRRAEQLVREVEFLEDTR